MSFGFLDLILSGLVTRAVRILGLIELLQGLVMAEWKCCGDEDRSSGDQVAGI
jgi:hypothetical protein